MECTALNTKFDQSVIVIRAFTMTGIFYRLGIFLPYSLPKIPNLVFIVTGKRFGKRPEFFTWTQIQVQNTQNKTWPHLQVNFWIPWRIRLPIRVIRPQFGLTK